MTKLLMNPNHMSCLILTSLGNVKLLQILKPVPLLIPIYKNGKRVYDLPKIDEIRQYCKSQIDTLWDEVLRLERPHQYYGIYH